jgi:hypothetical protein
MIKQAIRHTQLKRGEGGGIQPGLLSRNALSR